jgi:hypothetical protein
MMNSSWFLDVLAIEKERLSSVPGILMSMYCPGKKVTSAGSISLSTRWRRSCVTVSRDTTSATAFTMGSPERIISSSKLSSSIVTSSYTCARHRSVNPSSLS